MSGRGIGGAAVNDEGDDWTVVYGLDKGGQCGHVQRFAMQLPR